MTKTYGGIGLLVLAFAMLLVNLSDAVADLHTWHNATTPEFVAVFIKQLGSVLMAAVGGNLLPTAGGNQKGTM